MTTVGNLICLTPLDSYVVDEPIHRGGFLGRLEKRTGAFVRSPGIAFPYLIGFMRRNGVLSSATRVVVQHDKLEGATPFEEILRRKVDLRRGKRDVLFITAYTNSAREAYRRAREAREAWRQAGREVTIVLGGPHASALPEEGTRYGHLDAAVPGEGEWAASELIGDLEKGLPVKPVYRAPFAKIRHRGALTLDMGIWRGLDRPPHQIVASTHFARGCKLDCSFCGVFLTNGPTVRNRDVEDVVQEIKGQGPAHTRENISDIGPGFFNSVLRSLVGIPGVGHLWGNRLIRAMGPGFTDRFFFWDDNLYNAAGPFKELCQAVRPLGRPWSAELTIDLAEKPELLKIAHDSGCRDLFLGIESVNQSAIDGLNKWSNDTEAMKERVRRVHDAGIRIMGAFVFGLDGDDASVFDRTLEFIYETKIDYIVANIIQPYPGTATFKDAVASDSFLPAARRPADSDVAMDYNWSRFDGAHVLVRPTGMSEDQLQEGYFYFLKEAYSMPGMLRRLRGWPVAAAGHMMRNYLLSRYGMNKTGYAIEKKTAMTDSGAAAERAPRSGRAPVEAGDLAP